VERSILPLATSVDGRRFTLQASLDGLAFRVGGYVALEGDAGPALGQLRSLAMEQADLGELALGAESAGGIDVRARLPIRLARGEGTILDAGGEPFRDRVARPATDAEVRAWLEGVAPRRARLAVGRLSLSGEAAFQLDAGGFDRHTFLCGQSGSGKSYALGLILEQLLLETELRIVILDPNSDMVRLAEVRDGAEPSVAERWRERAVGVAVRAAGPAGADRLRLRFPELDQRAQGALLRLDPVADREEYAELAVLLARGSPAGLADLDSRPLQMRIANLAVDRLGVWARDDPGSVLDDVVDPAARCVVVDLGSLPTREEQALVAEAVLRRLWDRRAERRPVLVVVDEAHNVCPAAPEDALTALATEHAVRIAGEGRKFGIYMLVATQRPQKVHENVVSQCDNLILMRLNSSADAGFITARLGFAPPGLVALATDFRLGEALVAGKIGSHPAVIRFGSRVAQEGGGDVDAAWAVSAGAARG